MNFIGELKKRILLVIGLMIVCAGGLGAEKYFTSHGGTYFVTDAFVQCMMRLDTPADSKIYLEPRPNFIRSPMELYRFINATKTDFDYDKFCGNWSKMTELEQIFWINDHLYIEQYEHDICILSARIEAAVPHDYEYCKANLRRWLDAYVAFAREECAKSGVGNLIEIEHVELIPEGKTFSRRRIVFKYAAIGAVLGLLVGLIACFGLAMRKSGNE